MNMKAVYLEEMAAVWTFKETPTNPSIFFSYVLSVTLAGSLKRSMASEAVY